MRKLTALLVLALALVGCGAPKVTSSEYEYKYTDNKGTEQTIFVNVELEDGKISKIEIDETYVDAEGNPTTKKEMKEAYYMKTYGGSKGEWYEEIAHLEKELVGTDGNFTLDETGRATDADILTGCTIGLTEIQKAVVAAVADAK